jgi:hypothetical protein
MSNAQDYISFASPAIFDTAILKRMPLRPTGLIAFIIITLTTTK